MAAPSVCFVSTEIFPGTPGGIGRLIQQSALALEHAGWPSVLLLDVPEAATEKFRVYARSMLPRTSCVTVAELLTGLATDDDIPLWAFHFPEYWRSYRVALALRGQSDRTGPIRILFSGKLQRLKGTDLFVRAAVDLCQRRPERFEFDLVGPEASESWRYPSFRVELEALIPPGMRDRFHFHGAIEPSRLRELALSSAIAVVPSRIETFCLAAHELNWIGIPLVLNDLPAFADYFRDGENCRTFDGTAEGLRRVLDELLSTSAPFAVWRWSDFSGASDPVPLYRQVLAACR